MNVRKLRGIRAGGLACLMVLHLSGVLAGQDDRPSPLEAQKVVVLNLAIDGIVTQLEHEPQDLVKKGELLVQLDPYRVKLEVDSLKTQIEINRTVEAPENKIRYTYASENLEIIKKLYQYKIGEARAASEKELKEATQSSEIAAKELSRVGMDRKVLEFRMRQNQKILDQHSLRAPFDGVIVPFSSIKALEDRKLKPIEVGEVVVAGSPVMAIMKVDYLQIPWTLPIAELSSVQLGQKVKVVVDQPNSELIDAKIVYISPTIDYPTQTFDIKVEFTNPRADRYEKLPQGSYPYSYRPGMKGWVRLH